MAAPARPGSRADRVRPRPVRQGHGVPVLPGARRGLVPWPRPAPHPRALPRRQPRRLGPGGAQVPPLHDRHRRPDPARDRVRDGHQERRGRGRGGHRLLRRRRDQPGRRERGVRLGVRLQRPRGLLLPEQPVGHLRAGRAAEPRPDLPAGTRVRLPRRPGRRQRRARLLRGDQARAAGRPRGPGPHADRGVHLPDGRPHHDRRPHQVPALERARGLAAARSDRARPGLPGPHRRGRQRLLRRGQRGGRRRGGAPAGRLPGAARSGPAGAVRQRLRGTAPDSRRGTGPVCGLPGRVRRRRRGGGRRGGGRDGGREHGGKSMSTITLSRALNAGLRRSLESDPKVMIMGEDVGKLGGVFRVTDGLQKDFGEHRVVDTPLSEAGIVGTAIGLALRGYRPVCEIQFDGFVFPAFDQIVSQLAKMRYRSNGTVSLPIVIRIPFGGGIGAVEHHSESPEAYFAHTPGLRVVACADPADAFAMIQLAIAGDDPVIFFEPKRRYWDKGEIDTAAPLESALPLDRARTVLPGDDVTLLCYGPLVRSCVEAAIAAREDGRSIEVIDLRSLSPIDVATITESVARTGRCVVVHEAPVYAGLGAEIAARVTEQCFYPLEAPVLRVGGFAPPYPAARSEDHYLPALDRILDAVDRTFAF